MELTRKDFYELAEYARDFALELARREQDRVSPVHSREFNAWRLRVMSFSQLAEPLADLGPARQITRLQVVVAGAALLFVLIYLLRGVLDRTWMNIFLWGASMSLILLWFLPESLYSTTVGQIEAKALRVVEQMEKMLLTGQMEFSEGAFFKAKENLRVAREELRQQIYLARRRPI